MLPFWHRDTIVPIIAFIICLAIALHWI